MSNQVYANKMEVSCKAAAGKSICAFPDVCFTPPLTPATPPGVPIPYPNTAMASDCTDGSSTVQVSGQEVMLKNKSYFKRSSGDEAGSAPKKGVVTSQQMGKVYFNAWSMDVKIEGENVVRHLDLTSHNHASQPPNSPVWPYLDAMAMDAGTGPCKSVAEKVKEKCEKFVKTTKKGAVKRKASMKAMCKNKECKEARKCVLSPYSPSNCCDGKTPHHVVPAHCFMPQGVRAAGGSERYPGCEDYNDKKAPCVCVSGHDKSTGEHKLAHDHFDKIEDSQPGNAWTYEKAATTGAASVRKATGGQSGGCPNACTKAQLDEYHKDEAGLKDDTALRADSTGQQTAPTFVPKVAQGAGGP